MDKPFAHQSINGVQENLLHRIANRIRQSLELATILDATTTEVRDYLNIDRVKVYQFNPDGNGIVIAEAIDEQRLPSLLGLHFPADDIPPYARELFLRARQRSIVDVLNHRIGLSPLETTEGGEADSDIRFRPLDPCHAEYLSAMGVRSSIVVPIVSDEVATVRLPYSCNPPQSADADKESAVEPIVSPTVKLWGLLACHHSQSREVSEAELQFIQAVVDQVGIAITQAALLKQVRAQAKQEANINRVTQLLHSNHSTTKLQSALEEAVSTFQGSGGRLYLPAEGHQPKELYTCGEQPVSINNIIDDDTIPARAVEENSIWKNFIFAAVETNADSTGYKPWSVEWMRTVYGLGADNSAIEDYPSLWAITDIYREPLFRTLVPFFDGMSVRSLLIIPLCHGSSIVGCLTIFRDEINTEILWAGYHNPDTRQLMPRKSFEVWRQKKQGEGQAWTAAERRYAEALNERFSAAISQYRLYQQVQGLNATLEAQVEERTEQLQQSNQALETSFRQQEALVTIVTKIRKSLDIEEIFRVTTQDLSRIMAVNKASVYRFSTECASADGISIDGTSIDGASIGNRQRELVADFEYKQEHTDLQESALGTLSIDITGNGITSTDIVCCDIYPPGTPGSRYQRGDVLVVDDIYQKGFSQCHLRRYEKFNIRAFITVPIFVGQALWGILGVYQQRETRQWEISEVEFANQVAAQLGIALQHASLLAYNRRKTEELSSTLHDLKEAQAQLIQTEKMSSLGHLVAGIAHEVNNPINFIHANLDHLNAYSSSLVRIIASYRAHYPDPTDDIRALLEEVDLDYVADDLPKLCSSLSLGTKRIREIVLSLRNFSRLDESTVKTVDIHEGIESTLLIVQHRLKTGGANSAIDVVKDYGKLPQVECYAGQINQVFMNLIVNAIDAVQSAQADTDIVKTVTITTASLSADWVKVSIKDDGDGIQPDILGKLFDPFFTTKAVGKGVGLGLSISYKIIEAHAGKLYCQSAPGKGAEFVIELPIKSSLSLHPQKVHRSAA